MPAIETIDYQGQKACDVRRGDGMHAADRDATGAVEASALSEVGDASSGDGMACARSRNGGLELTVERGAVHLSCIFTSIGIH